MTKKKIDKKQQLFTFTFPTYGISVKATSKTEAEKELKIILSDKK